MTLTYHKIFIHLSVYPNAWKQIIAMQSHSKFNAEVKNRRIGVNYFKRGSNFIPLQIIG